MIWCIAIALIVFGFFLRALGRRYPTDKLAKQKRLNGKSMELGADQSSVWVSGICRRVVCGQRMVTVRLLR